MPEKNETRPEAIRVVVPEMLASHLGATVQTRMALMGEPDSTIINLEGRKFYEQGVLAVYSALRLLTIDGVNSVDPRQIHEFEAGLRKYLFKQ